MWLTFFFLQTFPCSDTVIIIGRISVYYHVMSYSVRPDPVKFSVIIECRLLSHSSYPALRDSFVYTSTRTMPLIEACALLSLPWQRYHRPLLCYHSLSPNGTLLCFLPSSQLLGMLVSHQCIPRALFFFFTFPLVTPS